MTNYSFNLIDRDWIWGVWKADSRRSLISLREALSRAHELREIHGDTPPETVALYRLLLTVLYRVFDPEQDWERLWRAGQFDVSRIEQYLLQESIYPRFDLFHPEVPFYQTTADWGSTKWQTVSDLRPHYAAGADAVLFDHRTKHAGLGHASEDAENGTTLSAAEAARALIAQQAFGFGGTKGSGISFSNAPCARGVILLLEGDTLFETLLLNFFPLDLESHGLKPKRADKPAWEAADPFQDDRQRPYGYLDYATWLNRKVLLLPEGDPQHPVVRRMRYYVGMKRMNGSPFNPMMSLHPNPNAGKKRKGSDEENSTHLSLTFSEQKALWRDSAPLFGWLQKRGQGYLAPRAFEWVHNELPVIFGAITGKRQFSFGAYGICSKSGKDKMYFYRAERFPLPPAYLQEIGSDAVKQLELALGHAEATARILSIYGALGTFACLVLGIKENEKLKQGNKTRVENLVNATGAERYFWSRLELHFAQLVQDLPDAPEQAIATWNNALKNLAHQGFEQAVRMAGGARALRAYGIAANAFDWQLEQVFNPLTPEQKEAKRKTSRQAKGKKLQARQESLFSGGAI